MQYITLHLISKDEAGRKKFPLHCIQNATDNGIGEEKTLRREVPATVFPFGKSVRFTFAQHRFRRGKGRSRIVCADAGDRAQPQHQIFLLPLAR